LFGQLTERKIHSSFRFFCLPPPSFLFKKVLKNKFFINLLTKPFFKHKRKRKHFMMKLLLTHVLLLITACLGAQTMAKNTISNAGIEMSNVEYTVSFTIGEPLVGMIANNESIDQGFWAGSLFVEPITPEKELVGIMVYPNPMINELNIQTNNHSVLGITIYTVNGKMAFKQKADSNLLEHKIDVSHLARGMYVLSLSIENQKEEKLFKVIKK